MKLQKSNWGAGAAVFVAVAMVAACQNTSPISAGSDESRLARGAGAVGTVAGATTGTNKTPIASNMTGPSNGQSNTATTGSSGALSMEGELYHGMIPRADAAAQVAEFAVGPAKIGGTVRDAKGMPVVGAIVMVGDLKTVTDAAGHYALDVTASPLLNIKISKAGFILRDGSLPVMKGANLGVDVALVPADAKNMLVSAAAGGTVVSADGQAQLIIPAGALSRDADVRVTWLNPLSSPKNKAAFRIQALDDTGITPAADATAASSNAAAPAAETTQVTELNLTDLPGPTETTAYGDRRFFSPVSFADVAMSNPLKDGETASLRMKVSDDVFADMVAAGDFKEADLGQDLYPCFSWNANASTWDKPALSKIEKDAQGYWFVYTVRANSMASAATYKTLALGDEEGSARVELVVGGGRRVVDGTWTYSSLIERSSNPAYDYKGMALRNAATGAVTLQGGVTWTNAGGNYRATNRSNLIRPNVSTTNYTGTDYAQIMGAESFDKWDRNGMFRIGFGPGDKFEVAPPAVWGVAPSPVKQTGTTSTAAKPYLPESLSRTITQNLVQTQAIPATYLLPFYYQTDCKLTVTLTGDEPSTNTARLTYTVDGGAVQSQSATISGKQVVFTLPRNAAATEQAFKLDKLAVGDFVNSPTETYSARLPVGGNSTMSVKLITIAAK